AKHEFLKAHIPGPAACMAQTLGFSQIGFALTQRIFGLLAVLDVGARRAPLDDVAPLIMQWLDADKGPAIFAVEAPEPRFCFSSGTPLPYGAPRCQEAFAVVGMNSAGPPRIQC